MESDSANYQMINIKTLPVKMEAFTIKIEPLDDTTLSLETMELNTRLSSNRDYVERSSVSQGIDSQQPLPTFVDSEITGTANLGLQTLIRMELKQTSLGGKPIPYSWVCSDHHNTIVFSKLNVEAGLVTKSFSILSDNSVSLVVYGRKIPTSHSVMQSIPIIDTSALLLSTLEMIDLFSICEGVNDERLITFFTFQTPTDGYKSIFTGNVHGNKCAIVVIKPTYALKQICECCVKYRKALIKEYHREDNKTPTIDEQKIKEIDLVANVQKEYRSCSNRPMLDCGSKSSQEESLSEIDDEISDCELKIVAQSRDDSFISEQSASNLKLEESVHENEAVTSSTKDTNQIKIIDIVYQCETCEFKTGDKKEFKRHKISHKLFQCHYCEYSSSRKFNLDLHIKKHTGERPFPCHQCTRSFSRKDLLKKHVSKMHNGVGEFECIKCPFATDSEFALESHVRVVHVAEKSFKCDQCPRTFMRGRSLQNHMQKHNGIRKGLFECDMCERSFMRKGNLNSHKLVVHSFQKYKLQK